MINRRILTTQDLPDQPFEQAPTSTYKPGDVVNGYVLPGHNGWQPPQEISTRKSGTVWWRSTWAVATAAAVLGLLIGTGIGTSGAGSQTDELAAVQQRLDASQAEVNRLRATAATADARVTQRESELQALEDAVVQKEQVVKAREDAVAQKEQAVTAREQAVTAAVQQLANDKAAAKQPTPLAQTTSPAPRSAGTDPRFSTCAEAKAAGFGPYRTGVDPEYDWYRDADSDGIVCE